MHDEAQWGSLGDTERGEGSVTEYKRDVFQGQSLQQKKT
jgi:hypothetical protein